VPRDWRPPTTACQARGSAPRGSSSSKISTSADRLVRASWTAQRRSGRPRSRSGVSWASAATRAGIPSARRSSQQARARPASGAVRGPTPADPPRPIESKSPQFCAARGPVAPPGRRRSAPDQPAPERARAAPGSRADPASLAGHSIAAIQRARPGPTVEIGVEPDLHHGPMMARRRVGSGLPLDLSRFPRPWDLIDRNCLTPAAWR